MKRKLLLIIIVPILAMLAGCENYMDKNPLAAISAPTFWKVKGDFDKGLTACYATLQSERFASGAPLWDTWTDNGYSQHNFFGNQQNIARGEMSPTLGGYQNQFYVDCYNGIARINNFLKQLEGYTGTDVTDAIRNQFKSEAFFLRAFYYFHLYTYYGDVPLVLEPLPLESMIQPKATAAQVLAQVIADLDFSIANGSATAYSNGHVTKSGAQALKARVLIYDAYPNGVADVARLTQVKDLCLAVLPLYSLSPSYQDLFMQGTQKGNKEIIFSTIFLQPDNASNWDMIYGDWYAASPLPNFVYDFENADGSTFVPSTTLDSKKRPINVFTGREPRFNFTVFGDKVEWPSGAFHIPSNSNPTGYGVRKFCTTEDISYTFSTRSGQDRVHIRLGEILLMLAEAENEISGPAGASAYMTTLRARVQLPPYPAGLTQAEMREKIRHERRIELAFEGFRYFDLKRWKIAGQVLNNVTDGLLTYKWLDKFYKWPLPQSQIDISKGALVQNPDYK